MSASIAPADAMTAIVVRGCRVHNLKNLDLDIPRDLLVVVTGPSGSGKSSLAFDTLFAEGQRQYLESLSVFARQFLHQMERPDVDLIDGLQPTVCIDQRAGIANPRSTVATVTEIYDHLRLLYARVGLALCPQCGAPVSQQSPEQILEALLALGEGAKAMILAPLVRGRKGKHEDILAEIRKAGFLRARMDGVVYELDSAPTLAQQKKHTIEAVIDRVIVRESAKTRLAESLQLAIKNGDGLVVVIHQPAECETGNGSAEDGWREMFFSTENACPACGVSFEELEPRTFSFNSPYGACPECEGLGCRVAFDPELIVPDPTLSITAGALAPWRNGKQRPAVKLPAADRRALLAAVEAAGASAEAPLDQWRGKSLDVLYHGVGQDFPGVIALLEAQLAAAGSDEEREAIEAYRGEIACAACGGTRLRPEARNVLIGDRRIHEVTAWTVEQARDFFQQWTPPPEKRLIAAPILREIVARLEFLHKVGLNYLTLSRRADTLSGGELQRVRLATGIGAGLVGVCYILDEPTIGLHPRDGGRLLEALRELRQQGNTVIVVEHDESVMLAADHLIELGPGAGVGGGRLVAQGTPDELCRDEQSVTGNYLSGRSRIPVPVVRRKANPRKAVTIEGVTTNNLKDVTVELPLSTLICVTGVSGSGKSSLLTETLARAVARKLRGSGPKPGPYRALRGLSQIDKFVEIDQSPIGRSPRSNPATYTGLFDEIRKVFTQTREARLRGYKSGRFSFNVKGGRCEACQGQGQTRIEMNFLPELYVDCPECGGRRFNRQTLEVHYRDKSIADVLGMTIAQALEFFDNFPVIRRMLESLQEVGVGYLTLGQSCTTLSGGEAQRIKLAAELGRVDTGKTLYLLDEPTTGLHFDDVERLLRVLGRLVDLGNTVIVIEHNLDVIKCSDWLIDLGPEGGTAGGYILGAGTPEVIAGLPENATGRHLVPVLAADTRSRETAPGKIAPSKTASSEAGQTR